MMKNSTLAISMRAAARTAVRRRSLSTVAAVKVEIKPESKSKEESTSLYVRLSGLVRTGGSVADTVYEYLSEVKDVSEDELRGCVKALRKYNRFPQAFELMQWMEYSGSTFSGGDYAVYIDLLSKVNSIDSAEEYFKKLPPPVKNKQTYGALLNCYCRQKMRNKALALFTEMRKLNIESSSLNYNNLMSLYMKLGEPQKVLSLVQEMKKKQISMDACTYHIWISCYTSLKNISGAETVVEEMETECSSKCDSTTYSSLAVAYINAGLPEKAELVLKKLENNIKVGDHDRTPYHMLISLYARTSNLWEVHRVWNVLKSVFPDAINTSYLLMLDALSKLGDINGLKKCFQEWESGCSHYDPRLMDVLIRAYLKRGMINEVRVLCEGAIKRESGLSYTTYEIFVDFFLRNRQASMALRCFELSISKLEAGKWRACRERVIAFVKLFDEEKDDVGAKKFREMLKKIGNLNHEIYNLLDSSHVGRKKVSKKGQKMQVDDFNVSSEIKYLFEKICPR